MIVCVGLATRDTLYRVPEFPDRDGRVIATDRLVAGGGPAATAAVAAAKLGAEVRFVGVVDDDLPGVETVRIPGRMPESTILVHGDARAIITEEPPSFTCPPELYEGANWVHVDHVGYSAVVGGDPCLSVDGGFPMPDLDLSRVELYVPPESMDDGRRANVTIVTRGAAGCTVHYHTGVSHDIPGYEIDDVVSTLGAGDVFHGALLAAFERGEFVFDACAKANAAAALSCRALDGRSAIPTWEELP